MEDPVAGGAPSIGAGRGEEAGAVGSTGSCVASTLTREADGL